MMTSFHDHIFPIGLAFGATCGAQFQTEITALASGTEIRNGRWHGGRRHYVLSIGPVRLDHMRQLSMFFEARAGRRYGFLYRDWLDHHTGSHLPTASDEELHPSDPERRYFPMWKTYHPPKAVGDDAASQSGGLEQAALLRRRILTPQVETVQVKRNQLLLSAEQDFTVDAHTGIIRLAQPLAVGETLTAGFHFYVPVRFDVDRLDIEMVGSNLARVQALPLVELPPTEQLA